MSMLVLPGLHILLLWRERMINVLNVTAQLGFHKFTQHFYSENMLYHPATDTQAVVKYP